jgi:hypothetical protein
MVSHKKSRRKSVSKKGRIKSVSKRKYTRKLKGGSANEIQDKLDTIYKGLFKLPKVPLLSFSKKSKLIKNIKNQTKKLIKTDKTIERCNKIIKGRSELEGNVKRAVTEYGKDELTTQHKQNMKTPTKGYLPSDSYPRNDTSPDPGPDPDHGPGVVVPKTSRKRSSSRVQSEDRRNIDKKITNRYNSSHLNPNSLSQHPQLQDL